MTGVLHPLSEGRHRWGAEVLERHSDILRAGLWYAGGPCPWVMTAHDPLPWAPQDWTSTRSRR
jgi:hypothetical protein